MSSPALELLARTLAEQVSGRRCARCGRPLAGARVRVRPLSAGQVAARVICAGCAATLVFTVEPETDGGVVRLH